MRIIGRIIVILTAALLVVGVTFAFSRSSSTTGTNAGFPQRGEFTPGQSSVTAGSGTAQENGGFRPGAERGRGGAGGFFNLFEVGKNLGVIAIIIAIVAPIVHFTTKRKQRAAVEQQQAPPNPTLPV